MKYRIRIYGVTGERGQMHFELVLMDEAGLYLATSAEKRFTKRSAIADARRFADLLKVEVEIDG